MKKLVNFLFFQLLFASSQLEFNSGHIDQCGHISSKPRILTANKLINFSNKLIQYFINKFYCDDSVNFGV